MKSENSSRSILNKRPSTDKPPSGGQTALEARFARARAELGGSREKLLRLILENPGDTFFLSSRELAKRYRVDAATIVRAIQALGYSKFADFAAALRAQIFELRPCLDAFRDQIELESTRHRDDRIDDARVAEVGANVADEAAIDLQCVDRKAL